MINAEGKWLFAGFMVHELTDKWGQKELTTFGQT